MPSSACNNRRRAEGCLLSCGGALEVAGVQGNAELAREQLVAQRDQAVAGVGAGGAAHQQRGGAAAPGTQAADGNASR
eukprot:COSAG04_NODE_15065_length_545_cov_0.762332_1_plen_77_part_01